MNIECDIPRLVADAVATIKTTVPSPQQLEAMAAALVALPGSIAVRTLVVRCSEYEISIGRLSYHAKAAAVLAFVRRLELTSAPEFVACLPLSDEENHGVLVVRYAACPGEQLLPAEETKGPFREKAAHRFVAEMELLASHGKVHPYARGEFHWLVSSKTGTLLMEAWSVLRDAGETECKQVIEVVKGIIERRGIVS